MLTIRLWISTNSLSSNFNLGLEKLISSTLFNGTRCMCAWGTSNPITATPTLLQLIAEFTLSDDLIIVTAGKQSNTFVNNVFTFVDTVDYTNNSKTLVYTGALLTSAIHLFDYNSKNWNVNYTYNYNLGDYNGVTKTITKS